MSIPRAICILMTLFCNLSGIVLLLIAPSPLQGSIFLLQGSIFFVGWVVLLEIENLKTRKN